MDRKEFLKNCLILGVGGGCLSTIAFLEGCKTAFYAPYTETQAKLTVAKANFAERKFVLVNYPKYQAPIYLTKIAEDKYSALLMLCTHRGCELNAHSDILICPCHGSEFSNTGDVLSPPATQPLVKFNVTNDGENLLIHLK